MSLFLFDKRTVIPCLIPSLILVIATPSFSIGDAPSPTQIVEQWLNIYPSDMAKAAELTTKSFREGLSKAEWIESQGLLLGSLRMKYLRAKVVYQQIKQDRAQVVVQAYISSILGGQRYDELYLLQKDQNGQWLIDAVKEYAE